MYNHHLILEWMARIRVQERAYPDCRKPLTLSTTTLLQRVTRKF